jgi:ABC-type branched-subunit amino acid transport system substrate-binding protein
MMKVFKAPTRAFPLFVVLVVAVIMGCGTSNHREINIGYIGPLSERATDLGIGPSNALILAVEKYNADRTKNQYKVNLFIEDDQWERERAIPLYDKLRIEHNIDILFISNSDGTVAIQEKIENDNVIVINPLNSDAMLSSLNQNTFKIAKSTEEANGLIGIRLVDLDVKKTVILHFPNDFMTRGANEVKRILDEAKIENKVIQTGKQDSSFTGLLRECMKEGYDSYVFFGYKEYGYAMRDARKMGITAPFFGSTVLLDPAFYDNSDGEIVGTECSFFTPSDGNYVLAHEFLNDYEARFGAAPSSVWPPMQAFDAMNIILEKLKEIPAEKNIESNEFCEQLRAKLFDVKYHQGVCGNISISEDGSSNGIYFSLYRYQSKGVLTKIN